MNPIGITLRLMKANYRSYSLYMVILMISAALYYNFTALKFNPQILAISDISYVSLAVYLCNIIFIFFIYYFTFNSNAFLLKRRTKEIGLYFLMGVSNSKIGLVFAIESFSQMFIAVTSGLCIGILTSKLFIMGYAKIAFINIVIDFVIPLAAVKEVITVFFSMSIILILYNYRKVSAMKLYDLLNYASRKESEPRWKVVRGIVSIGFMLSGYYFCQGMLKDEMMIFIGIIVVVIEIIGTNLFFGSFLPTILTWVIRNKKVLYNGDNITTFSNLAFRINSNYKTWTMLSITIATSITTLAASITLWYYVTICNSDSLQNYAKVSYRSSLYISAIFSYLGPIMALIFLCVLGTTLYFRILSEGLEDKKRYDLLFKIGMTNDEIKKTIQKQIGISLIAPSLIGTAHSIVAVFLLEDALDVKVGVPLLASILIFVLVYIMLYRVTVGKFFQVVSPN